MLVFRPTSPIHFHPIFIPNHQPFPPLRPGLSLWQVPPCLYPLTFSSPSLPSFSLSGLHLLRHMTRLATVASLTLPPASPLTPPTSYLLPPYPSFRPGLSLRAVPLSLLGVSPSFELDKEWIHTYGWPA